MSERHFDPDPLDGTFKFREYNCPVDRYRKGQQIEINGITCVITGIRYHFGHQPNHAEVFGEYLKPGKITDITPEKLTQQAAQSAQDWLDIQQQIHHIDCPLFSKRHEL